MIRSAWHRSTVPRREQVGPSTTAILKHPITQLRRTHSSPKLYGQPIQDTLPAHRRAFSPELQHSASMAEEQAQTTMENDVTSFNSKVRPLPKIKIGSRVALQNYETKLWDIYGTVTDIGPH